MDKDKSSPICASSAGTLTALCDPPHRRLCAFIPAPAMHFSLDFQLQHVLLRPALPALLSYCDSMAYVTCVEQEAFKATCQR